MNLIDSLKNYIFLTKRKLKTNSLHNMLLLVDMVPNFFGFSLLKTNIGVRFLVFHFSLLIYVYGIGSYVYLWKYAQSAGDIVKSYANMAIFAVVVNVNWWFMTKRRLLHAILKDINLSDHLSIQSTLFVSKHQKLLKTVKWTFLIFVLSNFIDGFFLYLPQRIDITSNSYSMIPCIGMEPLTVSPNREICLTILATQETLIYIVVLTFQALLLLLIAHTSVMYQMLTYEMIHLCENRNMANIKELAKITLPSLIKRHSLILSVIDKLKLYYSVPLGVNFGSNVFSMLLLFYLPVKEWFQFIPIVLYGSMLFFLYCFLCQRLINTSELFERWVYCCGWENFDINEMKLVHVMLCQAQKPVKILAADIIPININTFATTLQGVYKFVTVVKI